MAMKTTSKPLQSLAPPVSLKIAASKPRNPVATDPLLKKSGPHVGRRRTQQDLAKQQFQMGLDELRVANRNADD